MTTTTTTKRQARPARPVGPRFRFVVDTISELKKVIWPTRDEAMNLTVIVMIVSIAVGLMLGVVDFAFSWLVNNVFLAR
ncbi:MAG: preprotein translocase subunit SecE [Chloroflexi bacterium]|nr:preprotein translocase subunit SecE [Chloroflexota bacterium]